MLKVISFREPLMCYMHLNFEINQSNPSLLSTHQRVSKIQVLCFLPFFIHKHKSIKKSKTFQPNNIPHSHYCHRIRVNYKQMCFVCYRADLVSLPQNAKLHYNFANFLRETEQQESAIKHYKEALR